MPPKSSKHSSKIPATSPQKKWTKGWIFTLIILIVIIKAGEWFYFTQTTGGLNLTTKINSEIRRLIHNSGFSLSQVYVKGNSRTSLESILKKTGLSKGMLMTDINMNNLYINLMSMPWIKAVNVERRFPNVIKIDITEHTPIAIFQNQGNYFPISSTGEVLPLSAGIQGLGGAIIVTGENSPLAFPSFLNILENFPDLKERTKSATFIENRRWDITLDDVLEGLRIKLPAEDINTALESLQKLQEKYAILNKKLTFIDLRLSNKIIVRFY